MRVDEEPAAVGKSGREFMGTHSVEGLGRAPDEREGRSVIGTASVGLGSLEVQRTTASRLREVSVLSFRYLQCLFQDGEATTTS